MYQHDSTYDLMYSFTIYILFAFAQPAFATKLTVSHTTRAHCAMDCLADELVDELVDRFFEQALTSQVPFGRARSHACSHSWLSLLFPATFRGTPMSMITILRHTDIHRSGAEVDDRRQNDFQYGALIPFGPDLTFQPEFPAPAVAENATQSMQVILDIDDTVKSSGGVRLGGIPLGGIDTQYTRGTFYPGVFQFVLALAAANRPKPLKVAVLTARAQEFKWALQLKQTDRVCRSFTQTGIASGVLDWGIGTVLYGSVQEWVFQDRKGWRKFENFKLLADQAPAGEERSYFFVGDTGELDKEAGERMATAFPYLMKGIFLHVVSEVDDPHIPPDEEFNGVPVMYFRTYTGAALKAAKKGWIEPDEVLAVILQSAKELRRQRAAMRSSKWRDVERDIQMTRQSFPELRIPLPGELTGYSDQQGNLARNSIERDAGGEQKRAMNPSRPE